MNEMSWEFWIISCRDKQNQVALANHLDKLGSTFNLTFDSTLEWFQSEYRESLGGRYRKGVFV